MSNKFLRDDIKDFESKYKLYTNPSKFELIKNEDTIQTETNYVYLHDFIVYLLRQYGIYNKKIDL